MDETTVTVIGRLVGQVRVRRTEQGAVLASFRLASNSRRYQKETEQWVDGERFYLNVTCWGALAERAAEVLVKGDPVVVTGQLYTQEYETVSGERRSSVELRAVALGPNLKYCSTGITRTRAAA